MFRIKIMSSPSSSLSSTASSRLLSLLLVASFGILFLKVSAAANFYRDFDITWGDGRAKILNGGQMLTLSLDKASGSGFKSKHEYLFGRIDMQLKLVPGNSAGTVTAYYLSSQGPTWDEIDFEFLGNVTGQPYTVHTNVFTQGKGNREEQFHLWFDPTKAFHTYSILWNPKHIIFYVDGITIRVFKNMEEKGVPFPKNQAMRIYSSLWNADDWATQGGRVKTDWNNAPFVASYRNFNADKACVVSSSNYGRSTSCSAAPAALLSRPDSTSSSSDKSSNWMNHEPDSNNRKWLRWVRKNYMVYDYCADSNRFPQGLPTECKRH